MSTRNQIIPCLLIVAFFVTSGIQSAPTIAQQVQIEDLTKLVDQEIDIQLKDGSIIAFASVKTADAGKAQGSIKNLKVQAAGSKRVKTVPLSKVEEIFVNDYPVDVSYDKKQRCLIRSLEKRIDRLQYREVVEKRLAENRHRLWKPLTAQEHQEFMKQHRAFLEKTRTSMPHIRFRLVETQFFLFYTDLPPNEVDGYIAYLDAMYMELCKAFGLSPLKNIWCGKCVVIAFGRERDYLQFEATVMRNGDAAGSQGLCHQRSDGTVIFSGFKGDNGFFAHVLVHETAHGFVHRYKSTARAPSWLNEGMSDWLANVIVKGDQIRNRQRNSAIQIIQANGWGDFLSAPHIIGDHYGAASTMVEILLAMDKGNQFRAFFNGIKEGKQAEESLKDSFGISYQDLKIFYAQAAQKLAKQRRR